MEVNPKQRWITVKEMGEMLSLGRTSCWKILATAEEIERRKFGRAVRVNLASLLRWTQDQPRW